MGFEPRSPTLQVGSLATVPGSYRVDYIHVSMPKYTLKFVISVIYTVLVSHLVILLTINKHLYLHVNVLFQNRILQGNER